MLVEHLHIGNVIDRRVETLAEGEKLGFFFCAGGVAAVHGDAHEPAHCKIVNRR